MEKIQHIRIFASLISSRIQLIVKDIFKFLLVQYISITHKQSMKKIIDNRQSEVFSNEECWTKC